MLKKIGLIFVLVIFSFSLVWGQRNLSIGDIYVIGWNSDGYDDILFICFEDISEGTTIYFSDDEYNSGWDGTEGTISWEPPPAGVKAGSVIQIYDCELASPTCSEGNASEINAGFDISNSENAVYVYLSTDDYNSGTFTFITAFCNASSFNLDLLNGTNLIEDENAWSWDNDDNWKYTGSRSGSSVTQVKDWIEDSGNWGSTDGSGDQSFSFNLEDFTLPVTLSTFTAQYLNNTPTLNWTTQSESDNIGFYVYRNGENDFANASSVSGLIEGNGTTTEPHDYIFEDNIQNAVPGDTYYYWLESIDLGGEITHYNVAAILIIPETSDPGNNNSQAPELNGIAQNTPNPFNMLSTEKTNIQFALPTEAKIEISVFNIKGEFIQNIYNEWAESGTATWNGKDENGTIQSSGIYLYRLLVNDKEHSNKKMILMR